jgi:hypothetical protein
VRLAPPSGAGVDVERERRRGWILLAVGSLLAVGAFALMPDRQRDSMLGMFALFVGGSDDWSVGRVLILTGIQIIGLTLIVLGVVRVVRYPARGPASEASLRRRVVELERENADLRGRASRDGGTSGPTVG